MLLNEKYIYGQLNRSQSEAGRAYLCPDGSSVSSVTTILDRTKSEDKKRALQEWRNRIGADKAAAITTAAAGRGTTMHRFLEKWMLGMDITPGSNLVQKEAHAMASTIIREFLNDKFDELWGVEASLYYPNLYAGTTDCVGIYKGNEAIIDFKQTNKPKKGEWVEDYYLQMTAYALAHNKLYNTNIRHGHIFMCSPDLTAQEFNLSPDPDPYFGRTFDDWEQLWWDRVHSFYEKSRA